MTQYLKTHKPVILFFLTLAIFLIGIHPVLKPLILAAVLSYILDRPVTFLQTHHISRIISASVLLLIIGNVIVLFALFFVPLFAHKIMSIISKIPMFVGYAEQTITILLAKFSDTAYAQKIKTQMELQVIEGLRVVCYSILNWITSINVTNLVYYFIVLPFLIFYLTIDWKRIVSLAASIIPEKFQLKSNKWAKDIDDAFFTYLKGQCIICLILMTLYSLCLYLVGFTHYFTLGAIIGTLSFVPYIGSMIGFFLVLIFTLADFTSLTILLRAVIILGALNILDSQILGPRLIGRTLGVPSLVLILSIIAAYTYFGLIGVFLAYPVSAACLKAYGRLSSCQICA